MPSHFLQEVPKTEEEKQAAATRNRFDKFGLPQVAQTTEKPNRFDKFGFPTGAGYYGVGEVDLPGRRFVKGAARGLVHPIRAFLPEGAVYEDEELGFAGTLGGLVGAGVAFVPLYKGASLALRGVGLIKEGAALGAKVTYLRPLGRTVAGVRGVRAAEGALAFGEFETFSQEIKDAPEQFGIGVLEGLAFETAFAGIASAWRAAGPKWRTPPKTVKTAAPVTPSNVPVHPFRIKLERLMRPGLSDTDEQLAAKIRALGEGGPKEQLQVGVATILNDLTPGGHAIIPGLTQKEVTQLYKVLAETAETKLRPGRKLLTETKGGVRTSKNIAGKYDIVPTRPIKGGDGEPIFDVLLVERGRPRINPKKWESQTGTREQFVAAMRRDFPELGFEAMPGKTSSDFLGQYSRPLSGPRVEIGEEAAQPGELNWIATLIHEVFHHVQFKTASRRLGQPLEDVRNPTLKEIYNILSPSDVALPPHRIAQKVVQFEQFKADLKEMTIRQIQYSWGRTRARAEEAYNTHMYNGRPYFQEAVELLSWSSEYIFRKPASAAEEFSLGTRSVLGLLHREAPSLRHAMSKPGGAMADIFDDLWRYFEGGGGSIWERGKTGISAAQRTEYGRTGWYAATSDSPGMRVFVDGKEYEYIGKVVGDPNRAGHRVVRNLDTGKIVSFSGDQVQRPILQYAVRVSDDINKAIDAALKTRPTYLPVTVPRPLTIGGTTVENARTRMIIDTSEFVTIRGTVAEWVQSLPTELREELLAEYGQLNLPSWSQIVSSTFRPAEKVESSRFTFDRILEKAGYKGIVRDDNGFLEVYVTKPDLLQSTGIWESRGLGAKLATNLIDPPPSYFKVDINDWMRQQLREAGVREGDLDFYLKHARKRKGLELRQLMDNETAEARKNVEGLLETLGEPGADIAEGDIQTSLFEEGTLARAGVEHELLPDGNILLRDAESKTILGKVRDMDEAAAFARESTDPDALPNLGDFPGADSYGGDVAPPKPSENPFPHPISDAVPTIAEINRKQGRGSKLLQSLTDFQTLFAPVFSALENAAKGFERNGYGPAYTKIYIPAHNAMLNVHRQLSNVKRDGLGGLTFSDKLREMSHKMVRVRRKRYPVVTGHIQALTREEMEKPGGLLTRALSPGELQASKIIQGWGLENDIPRLMSTNRLINGVLKGRLATVIGKMESMKLSPEAEGVLETFRNMPKFKTPEEIHEFLGLTQEEIKLIQLIENSVKADKDNFSIYAVSRHASAPSLKKEFKNGQEQFAFENNMSKAEIETSQIASETLEQAFRESGLDMKRHLSGYWPHMKVWVSNGWSPDDLPLPPEAIEWVSQRFRSGELNVYDMDPLSTVYRHLRGLYMKEYFDPVLPGIHDVLRGMQRSDPRSARVMNEYVQELLGKPHASFDRLQKAVEQSWETLTGKRPSERLMTDFISGMAAITSAAVIPFRPALIARNYTEALLKVSPRTGIGYFFKGLRYVTDRETRLEAYKAAMDAGAIRPGTQRLRSFHAAEELFGPTAPGLVHKYLMIFDKGFKWYQGADDWGRAVAFHAQRFRVMDHMDDFVNGRISWETFAERSKILTFDPLDVQVAYQKGVVEKDFNGMIDHLGLVLSGETMTRYGYADHPVGWNSVQGRLFGQFGTWPVQYKDYLLQGITRGTTKDKVEFLATHGAVTGSIVAAGVGIGVNLRSWTGAGIYTGGPYTDILIDVVKSINGTEAEKNLARANLYAQLPVLGWLATGNPKSVFVPGSYFYGDFTEGVKAMQKGDVFEALMSGSGVRVLRADEQPPLNFILGNFR